jgi:hypothetical protein
MLKHDLKKLTQHIFLKKISITVTISFKTFNFDSLNSKTFHAKLMSKSSSIKSIKENF